MRSIIRHVESILRSFHISCNRSEALVNMTQKDTPCNYSFEPVRSDDPSTPVVAEAVPSTAPDAHYNDEDEQRPSDCAIMAGCGLAGWVVW